MRTDVTLGCHPELCVKICSKQGGKETRAEQKTRSKRKKLLCEQSLPLRNEEQRKKNHPPDDNSTRSKHKTTSPLSQLKNLTVGLLSIEGFFSKVRQHT